MLRMRSLALALWVGCFLLSCGPAAPPPPPQDPVSFIRADKGLEVVRQLTSDETEGRGLAGNGLSVAANYIAGRFAEAGLRPGGEGGGYFQRVRLATSVKAQEKRNWVRFGEGPSRRSLKMGIEFVPLAVAASDARASGRLVFVGYGITASELGYDDYAGVDVKGKIVVAMRYAPGSHLLEPASPHPGREPFPAAYEEIHVKAMNARAHGAAALIIFNGPRSVGAQEDPLIPLEGIWSREDIGIPVVQVIRPVLEELVGADKILEMQQSIESSFAPHSFAAAESVPEFKVQTALEREFKDTANVIGIVEGSDPVLKNEWVIVGAHYDHLGPCPDGKGFFPGADDNASGVAAISLVADGMARARPKRSVAFVAFAGKEPGLVGSTLFASKAPGKVVAMLNFDMVGRLRDGLLGIRGMNTSKAWPDFVTKANTEGLKVAPVRGHGPGDESSFIQAGVPALLLSTGLHPDYHTPRDTVDRVNCGGIETIARFACRLTRALADAPTPPAFTR